MKRFPTHSHIIDSPEMKKISFIMGSFFAKEYELFA